MPPMLAGPLPGDPEHLVRPGQAPLFRWSVVPGASGYEVEVMGESSRPPVIVRVSREDQVLLHLWPTLPAVAGTVAQESSGTCLE